MSAVRATLRVAIASAVGSFIVAGTEAVVAYPHPSSPARLFFETAFRLYLPAAVVAAAALERVAPVSGLDLWLPLLMGALRIATNAGDLRIAGVAAALVALVGCLWLSRRLGDPARRPPLLFGVTVGLVLPILAGRLGATGLSARWGRDAAALVASVAGLLLFTLLRAFVARWPRAAPVFLLGPVVSLLVWDRQAPARVEPPGAASPASEKDGRPDIVLIVLDTVRASALRAGGGRFDTMPNVEAFGRAATTFSRVWTTGSWTLPAHASLFTGAPVSEHRYDSGYSVASRTPPASFLAPRLRRAGYATAASVANFGVFGRQDPLLAGFDRVSAEPLRPFAYRPWFFAALAAFPRAPWPNLVHERFPGPSRRAREIVDDAQRFWEEGRGRPRFLFVNLMEAHLPWVPDDQDLHRFGPQGLETEGEQVEVLGRYLSGGRPSDEEAAILRARYVESLLSLDRQVGRLLTTLRPAMGRELMIVITADHGEALGEHDRWGHRNSVDEVETRVPLFVRAPRLAPGLVEAPTSLGIVDGLVAEAAGIGSSSRRPAVEDAGILIEHRPGPQGRLPSSYPRGDLTALVSWPFKYVEGPETGAALYDLSNDPGEATNLSASQPEVAVRMAQRLKALGALPSERAPRNDPGAVERLRALGYVR